MQLQILKSNLKIEALSLKLYEARTIEQTYDAYYTQLPSQQFEPVPSFSKASKITLQDNQLNT